MPDEPRLREQAKAVIQSGNPGLDKYHVHIRCYAAWEFERTKAQSP
jgi:hypothetical protein